MKKKLIEAKVNKTIYLTQFDLDYLIMDYFEKKGVEIKDRHCIHYDIGLEPYKENNSISIEGHVNGVTLDIITSDETIEIC